MSCHRVAVSPRPGSRSAFRLLAVLAAFATIVALLPAAAVPATAATTTTERSSLEIYGEARLLAAHQQVRRDPSLTDVLGELTWSGELAELARASSDRMAANGQMGHDPAIGDALCCGARYGDNVGWSGPTSTTGPAAVRRAVDTLVDAWLASGGHRELIMDDRFTQIGIGLHVESSGQTWATVVFREAQVSLSAQTILSPRSLETACDGPTTVRFTDVTGTHAAAIDCLAELGIVQGVSPDRFDPAATVSRAQLAMLLDRAIAASGGGLPDPLHEAFTDVRSGSTAGASVERLAAAGIVGGRVDGSFRPNSPVTRGQLAAQLQSAAIYLHGDPAPTARGYFRDVQAQQRFALAIDASGHHGLMTGDRNGDFHPDASLRRDHAASVIARYLDLRIAGG